ncbi:MAG: NfeD family protein [Deltaproteobacteria bacterium]|nr:NfeD family protein [Deltaproteobacteria bacterium]
MAAEKERWSTRTLIKYILLQMPALALLVFGLLFIRRWVEVSPWVFWGCIILWIGKDIILFPFLWRSYEQKPAKKNNPLIGAKGVTRERLDPFGYILIRGELWKARAPKGFSPIEEGIQVRVEDIEGLILVVEPHS